MNSMKGTKRWINKQFKSSWKSIKFVMEMGKRQNLKTWMTNSNWKEKKYHFLFWLSVPMLPCFDILFAANFNRLVGKFLFLCFSPSHKFILFNKWNLIKRFFSHNNNIKLWSFSKARCCRVESWRAMVRYKIEQNGYYDRTELRINYTQKTCNIATLT